MIAQRHEDRVQHATPSPVCTSDTMKRLLEHLRSIVQGTHAWIPFLSPVILWCVLTTTGLVGDRARSLSDVGVAAFSGVFASIFCLMGLGLADTVFEVLAGKPVDAAVSDMGKSSSNPIAAVLFCVALWGWVQSSAQRRDKEWSKRTDRCIKDALADPENPLRQAGILGMVQTCRSESDPNNDEEPDPQDN